MARILIQIELPDERTHEIAQYMRDYEQRDPANIHLKIAFNVPDMTMEEIIEANQVEPAVPLQWIVKRKQ